MLKSVILQFSIDYNFTIDEFNKSNLIVNESQNIEGSRFFNEDYEPFRLLIFKGKIIIAAKDDLIDILKTKFKNKSAEWFLSFDSLNYINTLLIPLGYTMSNIKEYFLPSNKFSPYLKSNIKIYNEKEILMFKDNNPFKEAFMFDEYKRDILGISFIENNEILGMAGASKDSKYLYQIGIDVLENYRGRGIGTILVSSIKDEILKLNKIPFYGTTLSHLESKNLAIKSDFYPAFIEINSCKKNHNSNLISN